MQRDRREKEHGDTNGPLHPGPRIFDAAYLINNIPNDWITNDHFFTDRRVLDEGQYTDRASSVFSVCQLASSTVSPSSTEIRVTSLSNWLTKRNDA